MNTDPRYRGEQDKEIRALWNRGKLGSPSIHRALVAKYGRQAISASTVARRVKQLNAQRAEMELHKQKLRQQYLEEVVDNLRHELETATPERGETILTLLELIPIRKQRG